MKKIHLFLFGLLLCFSFQSLAKAVAFTIDDLPFLGNSKGNPKKLVREAKRFNEILAILKTEKVPVTGFVIAGSIESGQWDLLKQFEEAGNIIGNHTYSHYNLNRVGAQRFIRDIEKADKTLTPLLSHPKYFRYPFLATGNSCKSYLAVKNYLTSHDYVTVPVTIDSKDFGLNAQYYAIPWRLRPSRLAYLRQRYLNRINYSINKAEKMTMQLANRPVKQIFLIHMNTLNSHFLRDVIQLFRERGYHFITVPEAMKDPFYNTFSQRCDVKMPLDHHKPES